MDPNTKLLLDEMKRLGERFTSLETRVNGLGSRFQALEHTVEEVTAWRVGIDSSVADLITKVDAASTFADKVDAVDDLLHKASEVDFLKAQISNINTKVDRVVLDRGGLASASCPNRRWARRHHLPATRPSALMGTASTNNSGRMGTGQY
jgi:hypothetical protein